MGFLNNITQPPQSSVSHLFLLAIVISLFNFEATVFHKMVKVGGRGLGSICIHVSCMYMIGYDYVRLFSALISNHVQLSL